MKAMRGVVTDLTSQYPRDSNSIVRCPPFKISSTSSLIASLPTLGGGTVTSSVNSVGSTISHAPPGGSFDSGFACPVERLPAVCSDGSNTVPGRGGIAPSVNVFEFGSPGRVGGGGMYW